MSVMGLYSATSFANKAALLNLLGTGGNLRCGEIRDGYTTYPTLNVKSRDLIAASP